MEIDNITIVDHSFRGSLGTTEIIELMYQTKPSRFLYKVNSDYLVDYYSLIEKFGFDYDGNSNSNTYRGVDPSFSYYLGKYVEYVESNSSNEAFNLIKYTDQAGKSNYLISLYLDDEVNGIKFYEGPVSEETKILQLAFTTELLTERYLRLKSTNDYSSQPGIYLNDIISNERYKLYFNNKDIRKKKIYNSKDFIKNINELSSMKNLGDYLMNSSTNTFSGNKVLRLRPNSRVKRYTPNSIYNTGDIVFHTGSYFKSMIDDNSDYVTNTNSWEKL